MLFALLFFLIAAHALMDFALQTDPMAVCKCRKANNPLQATVPWYYWLTAHAFLHGAAVGVVIRWVWEAEWVVVAAFAFAETFIHWFIDLGKCEKLYSMHIDQALHVICKIAWWGLIAGGIVTRSGFSG
ncbi:MAG: DUF3307 domain-containing protein [Planctomycetia bacterium]|nr:DUF3307 domain-containing protein [Planctomycetia bacterium]